MGKNKRLTAVGWLERGFDFPRGPLETEDLRLLESSVANLWEPFHFMGYHDCSLCTDPSVQTVIRVGSRECFLGASNLWVPGDGQIFVAPSLIFHYVVEHRYRPPDVFLSALRKCPTPGSPEFLQRIVDLGPPEFLIYTDQVLSRVTSLLQSAADRRVSANPLSRIREVESLLATHGGVLGERQELDKQIRALVKRLPALFPEDPEPPEDDGWFVDAWRPVRKEIKVGLSEAFFDPDEVTDAV